MNKKLSIITINYNNSDGLQRSMDSVFEQTFSDFEYIVIDGNSTDNSKAIIEKHSSKLKYWVSEPDTGVYNAMNKGILNSEGEYCYFLNSGDILNDNDVLLEIFGSSFDEQIVAFNAYVNENNQNILVRAPKEISFYVFYKHTILHQACFIKRDLFLKFGLYNEENKIVSDWEFFMKVLFLHQASYKSVPVNISRFNTDGMSSQPQNYSISTKERHEILNKYYKHFLPDYKLIEEKSTYTFLKNMNKMGIMRAFYLMNFKVINRFLKILRHD